MIKDNKMKKQIIIAVCSLISLSALAQEQQGQSHWSVQVRGGITKSFVPVEDPDYEKGRLGWTLGAEAEYKISKHFSLTGGLEYTRLSRKKGCTTFPFLGGTLYDRFKIYSDYVHIPVLLNYYVVKGLALKVGVEMGILTHAKRKIHSFRNGDEDSPFDRRMTEDIYSLMSKGDILFPIGISYEYKNVVLDARYHHGVKNIRLPYSFESRPHNRYLSVTLGYKFDL